MIMEMTAVMAADPTGTSHMSGTRLSTALHSAFSYHPHFTNEEREAQQVGPGKEFRFGASEVGKC